MRYEDWSNGIMEYWNDGFKNQCSIIPTFHYSRAPRSEQLRCGQSLYFATAGHA